jgi:hypothetical protein
MARDDVSNEKAVFMFCLSGTDVFQLFGDKMVPVSWGMAKTVECVFETPVGVRL